MNTMLQSETLPPDLLIPSDYSSSLRSFGGKPYHSLDFEMHRLFGGKVYKLSLQSGCSCPNRDGTLGTGGCIFCSEGGSGDFASPAFLPIPKQIELAKKRVASKLPTHGFAGYFAYFQSFTNTYGPAERLEPLFRKALAAPEILGLSIGTRPDCLPEEILNMLTRLNRIRPVWVELGLQTIHGESARKIRRGYPLSVFINAVRALKAAGITVIVHLILGLPGETRQDMEESVRFLAGFSQRYGCSIDGIKLQLLHILRNTDLGLEYERSDCPSQMEAFSSIEDYVDFVIDLLELLPPEMTVHRLTGDAPRALLLSPSWSSDKKRILNTFTRRFAERGTWQGRRFHEVPVE